MKIQIRYFCPQHQAHYLKMEDDRGQSLEGGDKICTPCAAENIQRGRLAESLIKVYTKGRLS